MLPKVFVIAGNQEQFRVYKEKLIRERIDAGISDFRYSDIIYVHGTNTFRGIRNPQGVFIGTWRDRSDIIEIFDQLMVCMEPNTIGRKVVSDLYAKYLTEQQQTQYVASLHPIPVQVFCNGVLQVKNLDYITAGHSLQVFNKTTHRVSYDVIAQGGLLMKGVCDPMDSLTFDLKFNIS